MPNVYACPVHVDQRGSDPNKLCPLCGQRSIVLRAEPVPSEGIPMQPAPNPGPNPAPNPGPSPEPQPTPEPIPPGGAPPADIIANIDQAMALLQQIRDRLSNLA